MSTKDRLDIATGFLPGDLYWDWITKADKVTEDKIRELFKIPADKKFKVGRYPEREAGRLTIL